MKSGRAGALNADFALSRLSLCASGVLHHPFPHPSAIFRMLEWDGCLNMGVEPIRTHLHAEATHKIQWFLNDVRLELKDIISRGQFPFPILGFGHSRA